MNLIILIQDRPNLIGEVEVSRCPYTPFGSLADRNSGHKMRTSNAHRRFDYAQRPQRTKLSVPACWLAGSLRVN